MNTWSEVDHDLVYKTLTSGNPSQQEFRLLGAEGYRSDNFLVTTTQIETLKHLCSAFVDAVQIADIWRYPQRSILILAGLQQEFTQFYKLYNLVSDIMAQNVRISKERYMSNMNWRFSINHAASIDGL